MKACQANEPWPLNQPRPHLRYQRPISNSPTLPVLLSYIQNVNNVNYYKKKGAVALINEYLLDWTDSGWSTDKICAWDWLASTCEKKKIGRFRNEHVMKTRFRWSSPSVYKLNKGKWLGDADVIRRPIFRMAGDMKNMQYIEEGSVDIELLVLWFLPSCTDSNRPRSTYT